MSYEIELKARVEQCEELSARLSMVSQFEFEYVKEDDYWFPTDVFSSVGNGEVNSLPKSGVRIRKEKRIDAQGDENFFVLVTYKTKEIRDGIEINNENEFTLAAAPGASIETAIANFEELLGKLYLQRGYSKKKQGASYKHENITVELSLLEHLGWFLELEIIAETNDGETLDRARKSLLAFLATTGISEDKIETKYYSELLKRRPDRE
jgi:adenylate cyclase class 2